MVKRQPAETRIDASSYTLQCSKSPTVAPPPPLASGHVDPVSTAPLQRQSPEEDTPVGVHWFSNWLLGCSVAPSSGRGVPCSPRGELRGEKGGVSLLVSLGA